MKVFHSIFALILSFICIIYLLLFPQKEHFIFHNFETEALAAESEHNTLSNALALSMETTYQEHIAANDKGYYYIPFQKNINFQITSAFIHNLKINFLSETGKNISYNSKISKKSKILTLSADSLKSGKRIFLCLDNQSVNSCSFQIYVSCYKNHCTETPKPAKKKSHTTIAPKNRSPKTITIPHPKTNNNTTSNPTQNRVTQQLPDKLQNNRSIHNSHEQKNKKKLSTNKGKNIKLHPQFIKMNPGSVEKFAISPDKKFSDFIWLSSNPLVATVANGKVHAIKEGITIIYIHQKNHPEISGSCFIRVIERT